MVRWLAPLLLIAPLAVNAQDGAVPDPCLAEGTCRVVPPLRIEGPDGAEANVDMGMTLPWVSLGNVLLTPGDALVVMLEEVEGYLVPRVLRTGDLARNTALAAGEVQFDFGGFSRGQVALNVVSAFAEPLEYGAVKVSLTGGPERTSVCPLAPGVPVIESWDEPIYQLALWGFRPATGDGCSVIDFGGEALERTDHVPIGATVGAS